MKPYSVIEYSRFRRNGHVQILHAFGPPRRHLTRHPRWATALYVVLLPIFGLVLVGGAVTGTIVVIRFAAAVLRQLGGVLS